MRAAVVMFVYAGLVLALGATAFVMAPEGASAITAILVPGIFSVLMDGCGIFALVAWKRQNDVRIPVFISLLLLLAFVGGSLPRALAAGDAASAHQNAMADFRKQVESNELPDTEDARLDFLESQGAPPYDKSYQRNVLWVIIALSVVAFLAILWAYRADRSRRAT
ncbi:MAG: hypothetical protein ACYTG6_12735 [Planctomycetota bacterium]|jgi:hypothetical protein